MISWFLVSLLVNHLSYIPKSSAESAAQKVAFELIYVGPGQGTYSLFSHVAVRVKTLKNDLVYDLGITNQMGVTGLLDVALGRAQFHGEIRSFPRMLKSWKRRDRDIVSYPIMIPRHLKKLLRYELNSRTKPKGTSYLYDPLRENCATQLRQVFDTVTGGTLSMSVNHKTQSQDIRSDTREGYAKQIPILATIEFLVGFSLDNDQNDWAMSYRPATFVQELKKIRVGGRKLLGSPKNYYLRKGVPTTGGRGFLGFLIVIVVILSSCLAFLFSLYRRSQKGVDLEKMYVFTSCLILYMSVVLLCFMNTVSLILTVKSVWIEVRNSWLLILACPLDVGFLTIRPKSSLNHVMRMKSYLQIRVIISSFCTLLVGGWVGDLPTSPLILLVIFTWGTCFFVLSILESQSLLDISSEKEELDDQEERSWLDLD